MAHSCGCQAHNNFPGCNFLILLSKSVDVIQDLSRTLVHDHPLGSVQIGVFTSSR
jgi:hypothetical protein